MLNLQKSAYPEVVQAIHKEFANAGDALLAQAVEVIKQEEQTDFKKGELLLKHGFNNVPQAKSINEKKEAISVSLKLATAIQHYKVQFSNRKFISHEDVNRICKKYNLVKGGVDQFKGFVPKKNVEEISAFTGNHVLDKKYHVNEIKYSYNGTDREGIEKIQEYLSQNDYCVQTRSEYLVKEFLSREIGKHKQYSSVTISSISLTERSIFQICAPKKDMITNKAFMSLSGLFETKFTHVPDPVVLYPVEYGYIIVTAWGDEASDPLVLNENQN